ncbi:Ig-like domain-containing protein [Demequina sp. SYSU T00068]|uniref:Ig-like domain-containing protein n=1 Tax=Demequina lignilytica TaxID=3051663 RepID=UPI00262689B7|nr:Ig-like domain-containing protein [Demequina sp. SYSU T00068]MDN4489599.1 Ig-like domain-containing protein [Demequina sp. SYSU T00068]
MRVDGDLRHRFIGAVAFAAVALASVAVAPAAHAAEVPTGGSPTVSTDFEAGLSGWDATGGAAAASAGGQDGGAYAALPAGSTITATFTGLSQGSYTLDAHLRGATSDNNAKITVSGTGGPDAVLLIDGAVAGSGSAWARAAHRNVLVYNGEATVTVTAGAGAIDVDDLVLRLDSADASLSNWGFEDGLAGWAVSGPASVVTTGADTGDAAVRLEDGAEITQTVAVEPSTRYAVTMRAKVDVEDTFETTGHESWRGRDGEYVDRTSLGDRVNLGVRSSDGTVLRQAPSGTVGYGLVTATFVTGPDDHEVELYANTVYDAAYVDSVTVHTADGLVPADAWTGNGADSAYVDSFDLFELDDENEVKGADTSFLQAEEDLGGKYFANGVQQDALRIMANRGVNSITSMVFVQAGEQIVSYDTLLPVFQSWTGPDGQPYPKRMIQGGYWDEEHTQELAVRAAALGMSIHPSFHFSDAWVSAAKAYTPAIWTNVDYDGTRTDSDLDHLKAVVYHYVHDFMTDLVAHDVEIAGVKIGNEQNGGLLWPAGRGATSTGHAAIITAAHQAIQDVAPEVATSIHTNNGYDTGASANFFDGLTAAGAQYDGEAYSLYGGRSSGNIIELGEAINADPDRRYREYIDVEAGFSFTRYKPTHDQQTTQLGQSTYYRNSPNGQYNWLLDYMQAPLDYPNPYGQKRGFYYWEAVWIPTPGVGSSDGGTADVNNRILFNNGDVSIKEMGSAQPGKSGDAMDSLYAYLIRGVPKQKDADVSTPLGYDNGYADGAYAVDPVEPTGISLVETAVTVEQGAKQRLTPVVTPTDAVLIDSVVAYATDDPSVATVTHEGFVVGVAPGTATVTATDAAGHSATAVVTVPSPVTASGLTVSVDGSTVADGATLEATVKSSLDLAATLGDASRQGVVYTSSDPAVASFFGETHQTEPGRMAQRTDDGSLVQLDIHAAGSTTVTATSLDGAATLSFTVDATKVAVAAVELDTTEATLDTGRELQLAATVLPSDASFYHLGWSSADESIATVDSDGLVTALAEGDVLIRAYAEDDPMVFAEALIHVVPVRATGVILDREAMTLQLGTTKDLRALVLPEDTANTVVTWTTSDDSVATVDTTGAVTGVALGKATVTVTTDDGAFTASAVVTVQADAVPVTGLALDVDEHWFHSDAFSTYAPDGPIATVTLHATVSPADATDDAVSWTSDDVTVARVNSFGIVTPVSPGVARITATTAGGEHAVTVPVYVPTSSDSFENIAIGDAWGTGAIPGYGGYMTASVQSVDGDQVLVATGSGSGGRGLQKAFSEPMVNDRVAIDFDWNVGAPEGSKGAYVTITDSSQQRYLSIQTNWSTELVFSSGGRSSSSTSNEPLTDTTPVGDGFDVNHTWYHVHAELDFRAEHTVLTITSVEDPTLTATHTVPFADMDYTGDVATLQTWTTRVGAMTWTTMLDDVNVYAAAPAPRSIVPTAEAVRLIPVAGTLGASVQLGASVLPAGASQGVVWSSADTTVATVTQDGLVTASRLVPTLADVVSGTTSVRIASVADPDLFVDIPVTVTDTIRASEFFWVEDEDGVTVFEEGGASAPLAVDAGDPKQLIARLTGGDGDSDVAGFAWSSSDPSVASIDAGSGELIGWTEGTATVSVVVTMYSGDPKTADITVEVTGNAVVARSIAVTSPPVSAEVVAGGDLDLTGLEVTASMSDGSSQVLDASEYEVVGFDAWTVGAQEVTVALVADPSLTASFDVTVVDQSLPTGNLLVNGSFEDRLAGWDVTWNKPQGSVAIRTAGGFESPTYLNVWSSGSMDFLLEQDVRIMPGWYTLSGSFRGDANLTQDITLSLADASGEVASSVSVETVGKDVWLHPVTSPVYLDGGTITAALRYIQGAGQWSVVDNLILTRVAPVEAESIAVTSPPVSAEVVAGGDLDLTGLEVTASMSDGSSQVLDASEYEVVGFDAWTVGAQEVTVALVADPSLTASFDVTVVDQSLPTGNLLVNGSFEDRLAGWDVTWNKPQGSVAIRTAGGFESPTYLNVWSSGSMDFLLEQDVRIMPGWYTLSGSFRGDANLTQDITLSLADASGEVASSVSVETVGKDVWLHPVTSPVYLDGGTITAALRYIQGAGQWSVVDNLILTRVAPPDPATALDAIDRGDAVIREAYSPASIAALDEALDTAREVVGEVSSTQEELDAAAAAVDQAIGALVEIGYLPLADYRIAVLAGDLPELPETLDLLSLSDQVMAEAVVWEEPAAEAFDTPYAVVAVHGAAGAVDVVLHVEVIPAGLTYLVDAGTAGSPVYDAIAPLAALRNAVADGVVDADQDEPWGLATAIGDGGAVVRTVAEGSFDKSLTAWENPDGSIEYRFWLPAGSYEVTAGFGIVDGATALNAAVTHEGVTDAADVVELDADDPSGQATVAFSTYRDGVVSVAATAATGASSLSWIGIVDTTEPPVPGAATAAPGAGTLADDNGWDTGLEDGEFTVSWDLWWGQNATSVALYQDGVLVGAVALEDVTPTAQHAEFAIAGLANGTYEYVAVARNAMGVTESAPLEVTVTDATPGVGRLTHDNQDKDGDYTVTFTLGWGTNGTAYRLYEDGVLIDEQSLTAATPGAQTASTVIAGAAVGKHTYVAELVNSAGTTATKPVTVTVR